MKSDGHRILFVVLMLAALSAAVYGQVAGHSFINMDDAMYVTDNPHVQDGITIKGLSWAFGFADRAYWHPVTWLSHMLDCKLFGMNAGMHHLMNVFFHILTATVLFLALHVMTGTLWRSAFVAGLFAMHPVNVDTVAWVAERKNLVSTLFWMLTLLSYAWYVRRRTAYRYLTTFGLFILGILSKPMLVTLPFVLLLLDYWPLQRMPLGFGRIRGGDHGERLFSRHGLSVAARLVSEKIPFLAVALVAIHVSMISMHGHVDVISTNAVSMKLRLGNAVVSYVHYLWKMLWPWNLTVYYPFPESVPLVQVMSAGAAIIVITGLVLIKVRKYPYLAVGWLWYLGTLVPVSGVIQAGLWPAIAERWMYVPGIGLFIMASWGGRDLLSRLESGKRLYRYASIAVVMPLALLTFRQAGFWKDDFTLFSHAASVNERNSVAHGNLADAFVMKGKYIEAMPYYQKALEINPNDSLIHYNYAITLLRDEQFAPAITHFRRAAHEFKDKEDLYIGLGTALAKEGELPDAIEAFSKALTINQMNFEARFMLAVLFGESGRTEDAIDQYRKTLEISPGHEQAKKNLDIILSYRERHDSGLVRLKQDLSEDPDNPAIHFAIGKVYEKKGDVAEAIEAYRKVLSLNPRHLEAMDRLSFLYAHQKDYAGALFYLKEMITVDRDNPNIYYNMACLLAREGRSEESITRLEEAVAKGFDDWSLLDKDADLESIRNNPAFLRILPAEERKGSSKAEGMEENFSQ